MGTRHADLEHPPPGERGERVRFAATGQGRAQESLRPTTFGTCLTLQLQQPSVGHRCAGTSAARDPRR